MIREAIRKLSLREHLTKEEAYASLNEIMSGGATESQIAAFLMGLRLKGETVDEIAGCAQAMRDNATRIQPRQDRVIDTCGTGGDASGTFNVSTCAAIIASAAGAVVAKHGNRAVSSQSGSADVLRALGVNIDLPVERVRRVLDEVGITFLFAPLLHGAMKYAAPVRRDMGIRTIFNILGPLTNPAGAKRQVIGVFDRSLTEPIAQVLKILGSEHALVVHGEGGLDELSTLGLTHVSELRNGEVQTYSVSIDSLQIRRASLNEICGGTAEENAMCLRSILKGIDGAPKDIAVLNASAALFVAGKAANLEEGIVLATEAVESGKAMAKLNHWIEATNSWES
jgi:anthranilate phosphoribosyltransferase